MSGEKCASIAVDHQRLQSSEEAEAQELNELEKTIESGGGLHEVRQQRYAHLRKRVSRRRQREDARRRRQEQQAEAARQKELELYRRRRDNLNEAVATSRQLEAQHPGFGLPPIPTVADPDLSSIEAIRAAAAEVDRNARDYQDRLNKAWASYQRQQAMSGASADTKAWAMSFRAGAVRSAADVIDGLAAESLRAAEQRKDTRLRKMAEKARGMLQKAFPEGGATELSSEVLTALDHALGAQEESDAQRALQSLKLHIAAERQRLTEARLEAERHELAERMAEQQERSAQVAELVAAVLEDMGYAVSGVEETAFVSDGHLYAVRAGSPDHVLRFEFDSRGNRIRSVPLRVQPEENSSQAEDLEGMRMQDAEFDRAWCSPDGLGAFRETAAARGVRLEFRAEHEPGSRPLDAIAESRLGNAIQEARKQWHREKGREQELRTRSRP